MLRIILHIDFDSFFASVEQQFNPKLRGKPLGVTAANSRTCIIASSREAKKVGIKTGSRSFEAKKNCPQIILVPARFVEYLKITKKFLNICKDYSPFVELFSLDEVFMDISKTEHLFKNKYNIVQIIKKRIKEEIGEYITVSVGISHNKLLAKLASGLHKPNGMMEIGLNNVDRIYQKAELTDICGIGERIKERLNAIGIYDLIKLRKTPFRTLVSEFGPAEANFLRNVSLGMDNSEVIPYTVEPEVKSVGRNYCLPKNEYNQKVVLQNIYELCEEVSIKLRRLEKKGRTVGIYLRGNIDFDYRKTFKDYFDTGREIYEKVAPHLAGEGLSYVRQIGVWVSNLEDTKNVPLSLFDFSKRNEKLISTIDKINDRFGDHTIRNGFLLYSDKLTTVPNGYMADKFERTKIARS